MSALAQVNLSNLDYDMNQVLRPIRDAFKFGSVSELVRGDTEYMYGHDIDLDDFFTAAAVYTASTLTFAENTPANDTITDSAAGFLTAGFAAGMKITISGSASNNKNVTILTVTASVITILSTDDLAAEAAGASVTLTQLMKTYGLYIHGSRAAAAANRGDSNAALLRMGHNNYGANDTNFVMRGINLDMSNRPITGILAVLEGALISVRNRNGSTLAGSLATMRAMSLDVLLDSGGAAVVSSELKGLKVSMRLEQNCPANSAGVEVRNYTDGVYTLPTAALAVKNAGTSGCAGFTYGLDFYDAQSTAKTWNIAPIRIGRTGAEDVVIVAGNYVDGVDSGFAPGSVGLDTTDGLLFVTDDAGLWQQVTV